MPRRLAILPVLVCLASPLLAEDHFLHEFQRKQLTDVYYSEGVAAGDVSGDGVADVVHGPYWFEGPSYETKREIYPAKPQNRERYADNFFSWIHDFDGDGMNDVFVVGFPGTPAYVYVNPGKAKLDSLWEKKQVFDWVSNESPWFTNIVGDERPELVCTRDGHFGYATIDWGKPFEAWTFHPVSGQVTATKFGHGLGVGDVNGDGRIDIVHSKGWYEQPEQLDNGEWPHHAVAFSTAYGGAEMHVYDVDGDGDNDVITSQAAHDYGLSWYEQVRDGDDVEFREHLIMGRRPTQNRYGVLFTELHSVTIADMDGDGLKDIITGKTYWSHHTQSPMWDAGAVVYWFKLVRGDDGVDWIPFEADGEAGIGRQVVVHDVNGDEKPDIVVGGMKGAHVLTHRTKPVDEATWLASLPERIEVEDASPLGANGRVAGAIEGENLGIIEVTAGKAAAQPMGNFSADQWSGNSQLWWTGGKPGASLRLAFELPADGEYEVELRLTKARDYAIVQPTLDGEKLGQPLDLFNSPDVITTGILDLGMHTLKAGKHELGFTITGANPEAKKSYMLGLDYVRLVGKDGKPAGKAVKIDARQSAGIAPKDARGRVLNLDFETGTLDDWTATGNAFADQPIKGDTVQPRRSDMTSGHVGDYWIGGYEPTKSDAGQGTLESVPFEVTHPWASFWFNGGDQQTTRIELVRHDTGKALFRTVGNRDEQLRQIVVDLRAHEGHSIRIRLVDEHSGGWGHVNFDHFRFHDTKPAAVTPTSQQLAIDEYPFAGLTAAEAAEAMQLPEGFTVTVGASEPDVKQPIAMALDDRGRVWIAEAYEYPQRAQGEKGRDRILIFEDTNGDGRLDSRKVFYEGLNLVSGLEVGFGGVWVGAAPYLLFIPDADGDDVPDAEPKVLLDGWGYQDTHETLNAFTWGPDGWLYGCHGVFTHSRVGKPGTPDADRTPLNAAIWRYHPTRHEFDVFAHGTSNPWGVDFNDHGQAFCTACVIPHLFHIVQGARYHRQAGSHFNPHTYDDIKTIADHLHYLGATPHSGNNKSDAAGGGHAHAGAMIYLGGVWPDRYRGQIFMNNIHGQRLNMDVLEPAGSGYVGRHGPDFLMTGDQASQILNLRYGPDGQAWMIDWYDMQACHRREIERHDRTNGRIFKIAYGDTEPARVDLADATDAELAEFVLHANDWYVRHARRLLQERANAGKLDAAVHTRLAEIATTHADDTRRLRAAWALSVSNGLTPELITTLLADASPYVRGWTVQLATENEAIRPANFLARLATLAESDPSPVVRLYLASAVQKLPTNDRWDVLAGLVSHAEDADDHNLPLLYWYAAEPLADVDPERALAFGVAAGETIPKLRTFMLRRIGSTDTAKSLAMLVGGLKKSDTADLQLVFLSAIHTALEGRRSVDPPAGWEDVLSKLQTGGAFGDPAVYVKAMTVNLRFGFRPSADPLLEVAGSSTFDAELRREAIRGVVDAREPTALNPLIELIDDPAVGIEAIRGLAEYETNRIASELIDAYSKLSADAKRAALATLCSRPEFGIRLLRAVGEEKVAGTDLTADLVRQLQFAKNPEIDQLLADVWGNVRETDADKAEQIAKYKALVGSASEHPADAALGRAIFSKTCQRCHVLYGVGGKVGPDLTGSNRSNLDYLLSNVVDPSAVMAKEYRQTVVVTEDGRVITGIVRGETDRALTIQTAERTVVVPKAEIDERVASEKSMMPDDQLKPFSDHEVRSLVAYLSGKSQAPVLATPDNASTLFDGESLAGWTGTAGLWSVEDGEIVGKSEGLRKNEFLVSDLTAEDFHFSCEVKLVGNEGNSGIQFRSSVQPDGHAKGYQADIGKGWWGKLYEEHGRALLWEKSGEEHVREGDWNTYEIIARGHHVETRINGQKCVDLEDPAGAHRGIFAFQLHSGGPTEVRFRKLRLEVFETNADNHAHAED